VVLAEQLDQLGLDYSILGLGEVDIPNGSSLSGITLLQDLLKRYGIEIVETQKSILVQRIKDAIIEMVYMNENLIGSKISTHLAGKLNHGYGYLSNLFSEVTHTSIENFIILQKIERAKHLMLTQDLTFSEIAWKLNYSSVAHFSTQFKNVTGLTPTAFQRIIRKRRTAEAEV
jgi:AraC-like DNA-binding protein